MGEPAGLSPEQLRVLERLKTVPLRRDFWDLHAICAAGVSLREAADAYVRRFGKSQSDLYHVLRALTYFDDAEGETAWPSGLTEEKWDAIRAFFREETPKVLTGGISG